MSFTKRVVDLTQVVAGTEQIFDYTGIQLGTNAPWMIGGDASTITQLRVDDGDQAPIGSMYLSTVTGNNYVKIANAGMDSDWTPISTGVIPVGPTTVRVTLTSAQILNLFTAPVTLIPAPGVNNYIVVESIIAALDFNTTAYAGFDDLEYHYTNAAGYLIKNHSAGFVNSGSNFVASATTNIVNHTVNAPIVALMPTADPTLGDSDIILDITYRIVQFVI